MLLPLCTTHAQSLSSQTITFLPFSDRPVTSAPFQVVAIASSNLPVIITVSGPATIDERRLLTLTGPGKVTVTAAQPGNTQYSAVTSQLSFNATPAASTVTWQAPNAITFGTPLTAAMLDASAVQTPVVSPAADTVTITMQLGSSQLAPNGAISYAQTSPVFRFEGSTMSVSPYHNDYGGYIPVGAAPPAGLNYRVAFTCDCQQFEYVVQSRGSNYRLWVDGAFTSLDAISPVVNYPTPNYVLVQFPDKRQRQIKVALAGAPPFFGVVTVNGDTISSPQVPVGPRVIVFGDSWTGPTIVQPLLSPLQDGLSGSGYAEFLGEFFNWDYWVTGWGGEGYTVPGTDPNGATFPQRLLTDVCPFSPAAVLLEGSTNDGGSAEATIQASVTTSLDQLQSCLNGAPVYMYGPQQPAPPVSQALATATPNYDFVHFVDMAAQNWIYGDPLSDLIGNAYLYIDAHPTPLGHNFIAEKIAYDLVTSYPAMLPAPYPLMQPVAAAGAFTYSSAPGALLPAGNNTVTATFTPADAINYAAGSAQANFVVNKATSTTALTTQTQNGSAQVNVTVQPQIGGTPTGSVLVSENGVSGNGSTVATLTLANGAASYAGTGLAAGTNALTFSYSGDANFLGSSATTSLVVTFAPVNFSLAAMPGTLTLAGGATGNVSLLITPTNNTPATLQLTCSGLPAGSTCALAGGQSVAIAGSPVTANVTISARNPTSAVARWTSNSIAFCGVLSAGLLAFGGRRRRAVWTTTLASVTLLFLPLAAFTGCGTQSSTQPGSQSKTYSVQLQLTDSAAASITQTATITLTVQ